MSKAAIICIIVAFSAFAAVMWPSVRYTNCGGNSEALADVGNYASAVAFVVLNRERPFRVTEVDPGDRQMFASIARGCSTPDARYLISTAPITENDLDPPCIIIVCDKSYNNVPERRYFSAPYTHAVGYSDGSKGLISVAQFAKLDRSKFVPIEQQFPTE